MLIWSAVLIYAGRGNIFYADEWHFVLDRNGWSDTSLLGPNNEHLSLVPALLYKALLPIAGLDNYWLFRLVGIATQLLCVSLLFTYARRRVGDWAAVALAILLLCLGLAWEDTLWPFQAAWFISISAGIGALLCLDRDSRRFDSTACGLLALGLASSGIGIPFAVGISAEFLARKDRRKRVWISALPLVLFAAWAALYGESSPIEWQSIAILPLWVGTAAAGAVGALLGIGLPVAWLLLAAAISVVVRQLWTARQGNLRVLGLAIAVIGFWLTTGLARDLNHGRPFYDSTLFTQPNQSRYLYVGGAILLLLAAELFRGTAPRGRQLAVIAAAVGLSVVLSVQPLFNEGRTRLHNNSELLGGALAAVELASDSVASDFPPEWRIATPIRAGAYLDAVRKYGSAAPSLAELPALPENARTLLDRTSQRALDVKLALATSKPSANGCQPLTGNSIVEFPLPASGLVFTAGAAEIKIKARRFASDYSTTYLYRVKPQTTARLRIPRDRSARQWFVRPSSRLNYLVCHLASGSDQPRRR